MNGPAITPEEMSRMPKSTLNLLSETLGLAGLNLYDATTMEHEELINKARKRLGKEGMKVPNSIPNDIMLVRDPILMEEELKEYEARTQGGRR